MSLDHQLFEPPARTSAIGSTDFSPQKWEKVRSRGISPRWVGALDDTDELRQEFLAGARLLGYELADLDDLDAIDALRSSDPGREPLQPQQLLLADALNADAGRMVVEMPRRSSKTTTILAWCLGRCVSRPRYKVTFSAQTGIAGIQALDEWARDYLDRINPPDDLDLPPWLRDRQRGPSAAATRHLALFGSEILDTANHHHGRGFKILRGNTKAGIYFDNGSSFAVIRPEAGAYRGKAADVSWLDEAQEIDPLTGDALMAGILPLHDTRPDSKIIIAGTAGESRAGPFWRLLTQLRRADPGVGGVDYAAPEDTPWESIEDETKAMRLLARVHPGVGTLTTTEIMRERWHDLPRPQWAREYLSVWPETFGERVIAADLWQKARTTSHAHRPARFALGLDIQPGGSTAAIVAAWRDSRGVAHIEIVNHQTGTTWLKKRLPELSIKYRLAIAYDHIGEGEATATEAKQEEPRTRLQVQPYRDTAAGCVQIMRDLERGTLKHYDQPGLNAAVEVATRRHAGRENGLWLWTTTTGDITPLMAATRALRQWDKNMGARQGPRRPIMGD